MDGIDELIKAGEEALKAIEERSVQEKLEAEVYEVNRRTEFLSKLGELLPEVIRPYLVFECWHTPNRDSLNTWNAQAKICIFDMAQIRILCSVYEPFGKDEMSVQLYDRHSNQPFHVLDWRPRLNNFDNDFYTGYEEVWEGNDLTIALIHAKRTGDNFDAVQEEVDHRNLEKAAERIQDQPVKISTIEVLGDVLRDLIVEEIQKQRQLELE